ncbi:MAG TPA: type 4a pilus biogenesis protein PilO [Verrucomicrobiae bacterium]|nr:type 4a pilus biogenesis protein PilO [Verrucomicrobiae bacterium]
MNPQNRQRLLLILTLVAMGLYLGDWLVFEPMIKLWKARQVAVAELRQQVNNGKSLLRREAAIRNRWSQMQTNALPNNTSQAEQQVLRAFDNWARSSQVTVNSIMPQWQNDQDDYSTLDCRIEASGDIEKLTRFLYEIENNPMALQLESIDLTARDDRGQELSLGLQVSGLALIPQQP